MSAQATSPVSLETVLITEQLDLRPRRPPDFQNEAASLVRLTRTLKENQADVLRELATLAMSLCRAHSAGISIAEEEDGPPRFRWHAAAGQWSPFLHQTIPWASPSGTVLDRNSPLLMTRPERHFEYLGPGVPPIVETLLVPFAVGEKPIGTVWVMAHDDSHRFDREDLRMLTSLSEFASVAYQVAQQKTQLSDALEREIASSRLLHTISVGLVHDDDFNSLYEQIVEAAVAIMHSDCGSLQMVDDEDQHVLRLLAWRSFDERSAEFWRRVDAQSATSCGEALRDGKRVTIVDTEQYEQLAHTPDLDEYRRSGIRSVQSTPLVSRTGQFLGVVSTHWRRPHAATSSELRVFDVLVRQAADLVERARADRRQREADRRKDNFLAMLGHELRNPLAPLKTGLELLENVSGNPELADRVHAMMRRQLSHLVRLVDDLLDVSRITSDKLVLQRAGVDLRVVIGSAVELSKPLIDERKHSLTVEHAAEPLLVHGDFQRLTQVVANLLTNAARYMRRGGTIHLSSSSDSGHAVVRVRDSGFGIPAEHLEDVFEMFSQVPEHHLVTGGGLGIGLALSHRLIELHGGSIIATSKGLEQGSEFVMRLPLTSTAMASDDPGRLDLQTAPVTRRVLIVDDNFDAAESLQAALELMGHEVHVAPDGDVALKAVDSFGPDVVLLDIGLPGMNGYEVARRIRASSDGKEIGLIAITGWGQSSDRDRARQAGFDQHLTKPVSLEVLERVMRGMRLPR